MEAEKKPTDDDTLQDHDNLLQLHNATSSSDEEPVGVGAGGKGKNRCSASSSKKSKTSSSAASTKKLTPSDELWPKDLPSSYTEYMRNCNNILRAAMHQGVLDLCWAVAIARYMEAIYARRNVVVRLSPQHLVNHIRNKDKTTGKITKYNEIKKFLIEHGLVLEENCPFTGEINQICPQSCEKADEPTFKIKDLVYIKTKEVNEEDVIKLVNEGTPVLAVVAAYRSFQNYKDGIYEGQTNRKDPFIGRHVVLVAGFNSTPDGVHYWIIQNSWGTSWGQNGFGHIIRKCSRSGNKPSMFLKIIKLVV